LYLLLQERYLSSGCFKKTVSICSKTHHNMKILEIFALFHISLLVNITRCLVFWCPITVFWSNTLRVSTFGSAAVIQEMWLVWVTSLQQSMWKALEQVGG
jgi:hypothetical protein